MSDSAPTSEHVVAVNRRQVAFDLVKMAMMLWVVWGHLGGYGIVEKAENICMDNAKIGVNMPVFFVMSGYFAASAFAKLNWSKILSRTILYIWPHITVPLSCALLWIVAFGMDARSAINNVHLYWFLRTLAMIYLLCATVFCCSSSYRTRWILFGGAYVMMLFWPQSLRFWWCSQVIHMYPYFVFGLMVLSRHRLYDNAVISIACGVAFLSAVFLFGDFVAIGMNFWKSEPYWESVLFDCRWFVTFFARTVVGISGSIFVLFLADILEKKICWVRMLAPLGLTSLGVYVVHEYPLILMQKYVSFTPAPAWSRWFMAIGWFLVCHVAVCVILHFRSIRIFFFGDESLVRNVLLQVFAKRKHASIT